MTLGYETNCFNCSSRKQDSTVYVFPKMEQAIRTIVAAGMFLENGKNFIFKV